MGTVTTRDPVPVARSRPRSCATWHGRLRRVAARFMIEVVRPGTPLCPRLGVEYPVFCAGTGAAAGPDLVAAVSAAGGLRVLGAGGASPEEIRCRGNN